MFNLLFYPWNICKYISDDIIETRYKIERKEIKFADKIATFHDNLEEKDLAGEEIYNEEKSEELRDFTKSSSINFSKSLIKEQSNRFPDCQNNVELKNKDLRQLHSIIRNPSFDLFPENNEEIEMSLMPAKMSTKMSEKD